MRAELTISHKPGELVGALRNAFGEDNPAALQVSALAAKSPSSASAINFAAFGPGLLVMAWVTPGQLFLYVESSEGRLRKAAADVWNVVNRDNGGLKPKLDSLTLFDEDSNDVIAEAGVGFGENARRSEIAIPTVIGGVTAVVLALAIAVFDASWDLALGSVPAFVAAILALGLLVVDTRNKKLVWR
jgi:hypothetical protein